MSDLFTGASPRPTRGEQSYTAQDIEVLEGLEPVRKRPGMYIGGTDENAMHHLVHEVFDNAMDEAVAGFATRIEIELHADHSVTVRDNGRGIPVDPHPKFPKKSALEVIFTVLHSGGKFSNKVYETSGGLHGVGVSVVNALSDVLTVEAVREKVLYRQHYSRGHPQGKLKEIGAAPANRKGTTITFHPDPEIFGDNPRFQPAKLYRFARSKAYLYRGTEIRWTCVPELLPENGDIPEKETFHFPAGLRDFLDAQLEGAPTITAQAFVGEASFPDGQGRVEWAVAWPLDTDEGHISSYCNTVPTSQGGTHENGIRAALLKGIRAFGEMAGGGQGMAKRLAQITADDVVGGSIGVLSVFLRNPHFQGQTKDKLVSPEAARLVENAIRDRFDHFLSGDPESGNALVRLLLERAEERLRKRQDKDVSRKNLTQRLRLPGKLADCTRSTPKGTEIFLVEGDSAGGSAKQARARETQAILPLRGKILNVASATNEKIRANQEIADMILALGCGTGKHYDEAALRYEKVIIMTDADVDGAHIASLLMTYFYQEMPKLIEHGHLYLAQPPLFRITQGTQNHYARNEKHRDEIVAKLGKKGKVEVGRFKGLGEMMPAQLRDTTMQPGKRILLRVGIPEATREATQTRVEHLMGRKPEFRFQFIQEETARRGAEMLAELDV